VRPSIFLSGATAALLLARPTHAQTAGRRLSEAQYLTLGRHYTEWFFAGRTDSLLAHMSPESRDAAGGAAGILDQRNQVSARAGKETLVLEEKMTWRRGMPQFWHEAMFDNLTEPVVIRWVMDDTGAIVGIGLGPRSQTPDVDAAPPKD
jgi:hypothetical protein